MATTPNMNLDLPTPDKTEDWGEPLNEALEQIDGHDHSEGKGARIPVAGLDIRDDLTFNGSNALQLRSVRFADQSSALEGVNDLRAAHSVGGDLWWNNGSGTPVQITDGDSLAASSFGGISGLPSGTAGAAFAVDTFTFLTDNSPTYAFLQSGGLDVRAPESSRSAPIRARRCRPP